MNIKSPFWTMRTAFLAAITLVAAGCTQAAAPGGSGLSDASNPGTRSDLSIAQTLQGRPEFSDFRDVIKSAGLWNSLDTSQGLTVLAPTNAAFDRSDPGWRGNMQPQFSVQGSNASLLKRQALIKTSQIAGIHPSSDFVGKLQDVRTVGGDVLHIDGRTPGVITITTGPAMVSQFGQTPSRSSATMQMPPLQATNGLIYSLDAITVKDIN